MKGENGLGKTSIFRYLWEKYGDDQMSWVTQEPLEYFYDRSLRSFKSLFLEASGSYLDQAFFKGLWNQCAFDSKLDRNLSHLSGGEGQMLKLVCGLSKKASVYLLDEPFQFLDGEKKKLLSSIVATMRSQGKSFLVIEHNEAQLSGGWKVIQLANVEEAIQVESQWTT